MGKPARKSIWDTPENTSPSSPTTIPTPPVAVAVVDQLRVAEKKQRDRSWEKENRSMLFRGVPPKITASIKEIAGDLQVRADDVARAFLEFGLLCYQRGEIHFKPVFDQRLTLFPKGGSGWGKNAQPGWVEKVWDCQPPAKPARGKSARSRSETKAWAWQVSYRGIPAATQAAIREIRQQHFVPLGEVATYLLGHSLDAYQNGRLALNPQPRLNSEVTFAEK